MTAELDMEKLGLSAVNRRLHGHEGLEGGSYRITNPRGSHSIAVGLDADIDVQVEGHAGFYCGGMNKTARITVNGNVGPGVGENMMSGTIHVKGNASQGAGATGRGGLLLIEGDAANRTGIAMKGIDIIVRGDIGSMSGFMAQSGNIVVLGDAGEALGDSIYETRIFVRGTVKSLGADCIRKEMREEHLQILKGLLETAGIVDVDPQEFSRYGSARKLYNFDVDNASAY